MTTLPRTREAMAQRVAASRASFAAASGASAEAPYVLVLEEEGTVVGLSAVYAAVGLRRPFYNYRVARLQSVSPELGVSVDVDVLHLVNDYSGASELGTLLLDPERRGGGRARLLSYARLMLVAAARGRFADRLMAEIRGYTDDAGSSPFWEAVGRHFFRTDLATADRMSAADHRFIADLMPKFPIYATLLPEAARQVIARPHDGAVPAMRLLEAQGFRYARLVDIFDAGPCVEAIPDLVPLIRGARTLPAAVAGGDAGNASPALVANPALDRFAVANARLVPGETAPLAPETLQALGVEPGDPALVSMLGEKP
jgi:arginine N-succinyltransferase